MTNRFDTEVLTLREHCEELLQQMEEICMELDKRICNGIKPATSKLIYKKGE